MVIMTTKEIDKLLKDLIIDLSVENQSLCDVQHSLSSFVLEDGSSQINKNKITNKFIKKQTGLKNLLT